ncbi:3-oxoadipate enol-lactonase 2 [Methylobacterium crusticola]|uniref:3-oxoadipate enol-lactonase 2 n=1 Tax=Methylobacterium crusticola TaxID=1697972 RepID=A0ABQ4QVG5_9HYPH|nr:alpha/beta fold hydrolase [Methylobacterium crusticola]GJD49348.1 3-oxoadipate enol-lactonase 2 [Methylobacterium crusticola]
MDAHGQDPDRDRDGGARLEAGGVALHYRLRGRGPRPLVCVHGVGSYGEAWDGVAARLGDAFRILTFDLRGHGRSSRVRGRYEIDDFVGDVLALADHVGFARFDLAGFSLGGLVAQRLALAHPDRLGRLVLLATVAGRTPEERARVAARLAALRAGDRGAHYDASLSRWLTEGFQERNPDLVAALRRRNAGNDPDCYAAAYRVLAETDLGAEIAGIRAPTLIATGEDDQGSNPRMARFMHDRIPGSRLRILPGLRHSILVEAPDAVAAAMRAFLTADLPEPQP